jgi:creatinine amidohydrolase
VKPALAEFLRGRDVQVKLHNWWSAPRTIAAVRAVDPLASHASWMENFPWTRLAPDPSPDEVKPMVDFERLDRLHPDRVRGFLGEGNFGGAYRKPDEAILEIWRVAVEETRAQLEDWE